MSKFSVNWTVAEGEELVAAVVILYNPETDMWRTNAKQPPGMMETFPKAWIAERLRSIATTIELEGILDGEGGSQDDEGTGNR